MHYPLLRRLAKRPRLHRPAEVQRLCPRRDSGFIRPLSIGDFARGSEFESHSELHLARVVSHCRGADDAELTITGIPGAVWRCEARMVEGIENVRAELHFHGFSGRELLIDAGIEVVDSVGAQAGKVAGSIAPHLVAWIGEAVDVEIRRLSERGLTVADSRAASA